jgi:hypothetical protein
LWQYTVWPFSANIALAVGLCILAFVFWQVYEGKYRKPLLFLILLLFSNAILFVTSGVKAVFINVGVSLVVPILTAFVLYQIFRWQKVLATAILGIVIAVNVFVIFRDNQKGNVLFQVQNQVRFKEELAIVAYTYKKANGKPFGITTVTNPLFVPATWAYVYNFYATRNNLQLPFYRGNAASEYPGDKLFPRSDAPRDIEFLIIEPQPSIPDEWIVKTRVEEQLLRGAFTKELSIGTFTLHERKH